MCRCCCHRRANWPAIATASWWSWWNTLAGSTKLAHSSVTQYVIQAARRAHRGGNPTKTINPSPGSSYMPPSYAQVSLAFELQCLHLFFLPYHTGCLMFTADHASLPKPVCHATFLGCNLHPLLYAMLIVVCNAFYAMLFDCVQCCMRCVLHSTLL